jgi:hypothetical protein
VGLGIAAADVLGPPAERFAFGYGHVVDADERFLVQAAHPFGVEVDAAHEGVEEHHVLISGRVHIEAVVGSPAPAAQAVAERRVGGAVFRAQPFVQAVDPVPRRGPEIGVGARHHFPVDDKGEQKVGLEVKDGVRHERTGVQRRPFDMHPGQRLVVYPLRAASNRRKSPRAFWNKPIYDMPNLPGDRLPKEKELPP